MKKLLFSFLALGALVITSCSSDPCKDKTATTLCTGNGTLVDNNGTCGCNCNEGYEGTACATLSIDKFKGTWTAVDIEGTNTVGPYSVSAAQGNSLSTVLLGNFSNLGSPVSATVTGTTLTIPNQVLGTAYTVKGSGTYATTTTGSASITMKYEITRVSDNKVLSYTGTWTK